MPPELPFIELKSVDSTNNYARQQINAARLPGRQGEVVSGTAFFAHEQVAGKGQQGKQWASQKGMNIALSILIKPEGLPLEKQFSLSACVAVVLRNFFAQYAGDETRIKWPNDLYWQDRKAGGVLIESVIRSSEPNPWSWAIIGIGININQVRFSAELHNPVSLKQITGKTFEPVELAKQLHQKVVGGIQQLAENGKEDFIAAYNKNLYKKGEQVKLRKENRIMEVLIKGVNNKGKLVIQQGIEEEIDFGTVKWII